MGEPLPLGLIRDTENTKLNRHLKKLERRTFSEFSRRLAQRTRWPAARAAAAEKVLKQFFALAFLDPGQFHVPPADADELWHVLILETPWYQRFCSEFFGAFYHHQFESDQKLMKARRKRTKCALKYWFHTIARGTRNRDNEGRGLISLDLTPPKRARMPWPRR